MAMMLICEGTITDIASAFPQCTTGWEVQVASLPFDPSLIDPVVVAQLIGAGFMLYFTPWVFVWSASKLIQLLR